MLVHLLAQKAVGAQVLDDEEVGPHVLVRQPRVVENVLSDMLHALVEEKRRFVRKGCGEGVGVAEPAHELLGKAPSQMVDVMLDPATCVVKAKRRRAFEQFGELAPQDLAWTQRGGIDFVERPNEGPIRDAD